MSYKELGLGVSRGVNPKDSEPLGCPEKQSGDHPGAPDPCNSENSSGSAASAASGSS